MIPNRGEAIHCSTTGLSYGDVVRVHLNVGKPVPTFGIVVSTPIDDYPEEEEADEVIVAIGLDLFSLSPRDVTIDESHESDIIRFPDFYRASGNVVCRVCGREYRFHPEAPEYSSYTGAAFLRRLCNGDLVKL